MKVFEIKSYGVAELACLYLPQLSKESASNQFRCWIKRNPKIKSDLLKAGLVSKQKIYTPMQVSILINHLGEPWIVVNYAYLKKHLISTYK